MKCTYIKRVRVRGEQKSSKIKEYSKLQKLRFEKGEWRNDLKTAMGSIESSSPTSGPGGMWRTDMEQALLLREMESGVLRGQLHVTENKIINSDMGPHCL